MITFELKENSEYIELIKLLKATNIASSGAQAKQMVEDGIVMVNNETEMRKRAKIRKGDVVRLMDNEITVK
jgi:ribosome-associated protein